MQNTHAHPERTTTARAGSRPRSRRAGFTIAELITTIAVITLLTVAIGRVFQSVGRLTNLSAAVAETDQAARAIERRLRADIDALNRLNPEQTFIVVRMREVGDIDRDGDSFGNHTNNRPAVYLNATDEEHDRRLVLDPYESAGTDDTIRSRAVTRRVDDVVFLAQAPADDPYRTAQIDTSSRMPVSAKHARIYWGHALRAAPDPDFSDPDSLDEDTRLRSPVRQFVPDGDFGQRRDDAIPLFTGGNQTVSGLQRNRYAADWVLARHALLLFGGTAAGNEGAAQADTDPIGHRRYFAPFIRDMESQSRFGIAQIGEFDPDAGQAASMPFNASATDNAFPLPRFMRHGRVDICAQDLDDVRRWLEGEAPDLPNPNPEMIPPPYAGAFNAGRFTNETLFGAVNARLWKRFDNPFDNLTVLRSTLAGTLARPIIDDERIRLQRLETSDIDLPPGEPEGTLMDAHAVLAARCSSFAVAWSDGSRVLRDFTRHDVDYKAGDLIWFDITPVEDDSDPERSTYFEWWQFNLSQNPRRIEFMSGDPINNTPPEFPELTFTQMSNTDLIVQGTIEPRYNRLITGGAPFGANLEAMALWGFRTPGPDGAFNRPWPKPRFLRVRLILHDSQNRLPDGKRYEFIFAIHPSGGGGGGGA